MKQIYLVEFGKPDFSTNFFIQQPQVAPLYVIAESYPEAVEKATNFLNESLSKMSVIGVDGSLNIQDEINIKSIRLISENFIL